MKNGIRIISITAVILGFLIAAPQAVRAHCDTMDGPVVADAKTALEQGAATPVLKWVTTEQEPEIQAAFQETLAVRKLSPKAKELADRYFFETLVRLHRESEGAPYTGLKPAGEGVGPAVAAADRALVTGEVNALTDMLNQEATDGIHKRFHHAYETRQHADETVQAGREYVNAYVEFVHYAERLHNDATGPAVHHSHDVHQE